MRFIAVSVSAGLRIFAEENGPKNLIAYCAKFSDIYMYQNCVEYPQEIV